MDLKLHQLECLVAVADHGSVRTAGTKLGRSGTAVSNALRELEQSMNVVLIERRSDGVSLTAAGTALLAHARLILGQLRRASEDVVLAGARQGGTVRMAITPWLVHGVLPAAVREFRRTRADVRLDIAEHLGGDYTAVRNGHLDFAFGPRPDAGQERLLDIRPMYSYSLAVVCRPGHPAAGATSLDELSGYDWLLSRSLERTPQAIRRLLEGQSDHEAQRCHFARSVNASLAVVRSTDMLTAVPWPTIETPDMRDRFVVLDFDEVQDDSTTCLVTRRYEPLQGAASTFLETFLRVAREAAASEDGLTRRIFCMVEAADAEVVSS
ncbi:LysR family transcriptional regulator [Pandoraea sp. NPDC090278]|uniref:LysR family transcriptional regulator n=1 Tax=Pandoraea sp. NPDC090278 TaxID=3364391 RepID=UPI003839E59B